MSNVVRTDRRRWPRPPTRMDVEPADAARRLPAMDVAARSTPFGRRWPTPVRRPAGHPPHQHPLPHRLHRLRRAAAGAPRRAAVRHRRPLRRAVRRRSWRRRASRPTHRGGGRRRRAGASLGRGRRAVHGSASRPTTSPGPQQRRYADDWFADAELVATDGPGRGPAAREGRRRGGPDRGRLPRSPTPRWPSVRHRLLERPTEAEFGLELDTTMRRLGAEGNVASRRSWPPAPTAPCRTTARRRAASSRATWSSSTSAALVDGYCSDMTRTVMVGEPTATQARMLDVVRAQASRPGSRPSPPGSTCARRRRGLPRRHRRGRLGRRLLARHRARRRPRHPRGAPGGRDRSAATLAAGQSSPSSPACTSPSTAVSASRTPSSSPPTAAGRSPWRPSWCRSPDRPDAVTPPAPPVARPTAPDDDPHPRAPWPSPPTT